MTPQPEREPDGRRSIARVLVSGVALIFGGEALCLFGPDRRVVHLACHTVLYIGGLLALVGAIFEIRRRLRASHTSHGGG